MREAIQHSEEGQAQQLNEEQSLSPYELAVHYHTFEKFNDSAQGIFGRPVPPRQRYRNPIVRYRYSRPAELFFLQLERLTGHLARRFRPARGGQRLEATQNDETLSDHYKINYLWSVKDNAEQHVKRTWIENGMWNPNWDERKRFTRWAHEEENLPPGIDPDASKPYRVFETLVEMEVNWLKLSGDGWGRSTLFGPGKSVPTSHEAVAREYVMRSWFKYEIWDPSWRYTPGDKWRHEGYDDTLYSELDNGGPRFPSVEPPVSNYVENERRYMLSRYLGLGQDEEDPYPDVGLRDLREVLERARDERRHALNEAHDSGYDED